MRYPGAVVDCVHHPQVWDDRTSVSGPAGMINTGALLLLLLLLLHNDSCTLRHGRQCTRQRATAADAATHSIFLQAA